MVDEYLKQLLENNLKVSEESLTILKGMRSAARWGRFFMIVKWVIIIAISFGSYYYAQPFLQKSLDVINQATGTLNQFKQTGDALQQNTAPVNDLLKQAQDFLKQPPKK